jgi:hypothetical protein
MFICVTHLVDGHIDFLALILIGLRGCGLWGQIPRGPLIAVVYAEERGDDGQDAAEQII